MRWLLTWSSLILAIIGLSELSPAEAGADLVLANAPLAAPKDALNTTDSQATSAGTLIVRRVAAFDFNSADFTRFGDTELPAPAR